MLLGWFHQLRTGDVKTGELNGVYLGSACKHAAEVCAADLDVPVIPLYTVANEAKFTQGYDAAMTVMMDRLNSALDERDQARQANLEAQVVAAELQGFFATRCEHISINKWLVQLVSNGVWYTAYFKAPDAMKPPPAVVYETKTEALAAVFAQARQAKEN